MNTRAASLSIALLAFAAISAAELAMFRAMAELDRMQSRNDGEHTMNVLFASLRDHDDFGSAIESSELLKAKIIGIGVYASDSRLYSWGTVPESYARPKEIPWQDEIHGREYLEMPKTDSLVLLLRAQGPHPPPRMDEEKKDKDGSFSEGTKDRERSFMRDTMRGADLIYLEIRQAEFWRRRRVGAILFPAAELATATLLFFVRRLVLRNAGYRKLLEEQKNLVILGTAASTLAHEIKNPLLAIRLQTSILSKTCPESARRELSIIGEEVERLSSLSHRVNDYLRDPAGSPSVIEPGEVLGEVGVRLCGRDLEVASPRPDGAGAMVRIDPERLRSILENLVRNALESGGPTDGVAAEISISDRTAWIDILDRGTGIPPADREHLFDPFFTTKSRGTGIGLAICKRFAEAAGGDISLAARPGGGTRARLSLPLATESGEGINENRRIGPA
jgi:two-component system sensor histidine kinase HydH